MDKVFSTRLDPRVVDELNRITKRLGMSKKRFLEEAIHLRGAAAGEKDARDVWAETCGAWKRRESPSNTTRRTRRAFEQSMRRHQRPRGRGRP
jgi:predicted transcriptional regulator